jgi:ammonia channel protein AmtB
MLPDEVAIHFGWGGRADSWAPKEINCLLFFGIDVLLFLLFWYSPALVMKTPAKWVNLPHKSYWLAEENKPLTRQKIESLMSEFGVAFFLYFFFISILTVDANLSEPVKLNESLFLAFLIIFLIYTVYWCIKFYKSFRVPKQS